MGLVAELVTVVRSYVANRNGGPGQTVYAEAEGLGKVGMNAEIYSAPGVFSRPPKGTRGVFLRMGRGSRYGVVIAMHNYQIAINWTTEGETTIFSTTTDGKTVKARADFLNDGSISLNLGTKGAARKDDAVRSTAAEDATFWTWLSAAAVVLAGLGVVAPPPTSLTGKITGGSASVVVGD